MKQYTKQEKLKIFRSECSLYRMHILSIEKIDTDLEVLQSHMENVHSPQLDKVGSSPSRKERSLIPMIEKKDAMKENRDFYEAKVNWILSIVDAIPNPAYQILIWRTYILRESMQSLAERYQVSRDHMYKLRQYHLLKVLTDEKMAEYDAIIGEDDDEEKEENNG